MAPLKLAPPTKKLVLHKFFEAEIICNIHFLLSTIAEADLGMIF